jgi:hypothetical protein
MSGFSAPTSPVTYAFPHIQWDALGSLRLTAQETALLRMAETNPIDYTLADSRDASMYARVLLKLLAEACAAGAGTGTNRRIGPSPDLKCGLSNNLFSFGSFGNRRGFDLHGKVHR